MKQICPAFAKKNNDSRDANPLNTSEQENRAEPTYKTITGMNMIWAFQKKMQFHYYYDYEQINQQIYATTSR